MPSERNLQWNLVQLILVLKILDIKHILNWRVILMAFHWGFRISFVGYSEDCLVQDTYSTIAERISHSAGVFPFSPDVPEHEFLCNVWHFETQEHPYKCLQNYLFPNSQYCSKLWTWWGYYTEKHLYDLLRITSS